MIYNCLNKQRRVKPNLTVKTEEVARNIRLSVRPGNLLTLGMKMKRECMSIYGLIVNFI